MSDSNQIAQDGEQVFCGAHPGGPHIHGYDTGRTEVVWWNTTADREATTDELAQLWGEGIPTASDLADE